MKTSRCLKSVIGIALTLVIAISLASGCTQAAPTPIPEPAPTPEPTPTPEPAVEEPTYHWRVQFVSPPAQLPDLLQPWADKLSKAFGGRAEFELYNAGELVPLEEMVRSVQTGTLDFALVCGSLCGAPIDCVDLTAEPPFCWNNSLECMTILNSRGLDEILKDSYEELGGLVYLGSYPADPGQIESVKPIEKLEDFQGLKINAYAPVARILQEVGATSVVIPGEEFFLAGQTGVIDAISWGAALECASNGWDEVYPYLLTNKFCGAWIGQFLVNKQVWDSLSEADQTLIYYSVDHYVEMNYRYYHDGECMYLDRFTLTTLPEEDWAVIEAAGMQQLDDWAEESPRMAEAIDIIKTFAEERDARGCWR